MDSPSRPFRSDISEDEDNNFTRYLDDNGIIGLEEKEGLALDDRGVLELEEDEEQKTLGEEEMLELYEGSLLHPQSPTEFSFSQMAEERSHHLEDTETLRNSEMIINGETDDHSSVERPSKSVTLPSALDRRPPSRDYQLDMTEDEVDRGSSLGTWDGEEEENWNEEQSEHLYDESPSYGGFGKYEQTSPQDGEWDKSPGSPKEGPNQEHEEVRESLSPSSPPIPSTWGTRLMSHFGRLSLSPRIEDETLPESSCADSGENSAAIPVVDTTEVSNHAKVSKQDKTLRTKPIRPPAASLRPQPADNVNVRKTKRYNIPRHGKRQLNYPLPDFSKVGPRVRFPRDEEGYQPPQPRKVENQKQSAPLIFKSPAEIVREVLLSSTEKPNQEPVIPPTVPQEFKTPKQATELVHQLQEDYHKLLTKYAEAENTIDRLRLGAKVHLYSDPPQPSHSVQMGTFSHGSKVMEFTIPHMQTATLTSADEHHGKTEVDSESLSPTQSAMAPTKTSYTDMSGLSPVPPCEDVTPTLMSHLETLHREVELFEDLLHGGNLTPEKQRQAVRELRGSLDVLERRYLKAQEQYRQEQRRTGHPPKELDPQRELEEVIFQLGVQLDELQERVLHSDQPSQIIQLKNNSEDTVTTHHLGNAPVPSALVPIPALKTPYPQVSSPEPPRLSGADVGTVIKEEPAEYLPQPLRHKHMQLERDYGTLLSTYSSFKSLPDALGGEQDEWLQQFPQNDRPHDQHDLAQDVRTQEQCQPVRSQDHAQTARPLQDPKPSGKAQVHRDHLQTVSPHDHQETPKTKWHSQTANQQGRPKTVTPQRNQPTRSSMNNLHDSRPNSGTSAQPIPSSPELSRTHSVFSGQRTAPEEGKYSAVRRSSQGSEPFPHHVSRRSPLPKPTAHSSSTPKGALSFIDETTRGPQSRKLSSSSKSVSPSAQKEPPRIKGGIVQRRILSPETDSGFLGSESGRSFLLQKQRDQLKLNRDIPAEFPESTDNSLKTGRRLSQAESAQLSRTNKPSWKKGKQNGHWAGVSEASSPSPGPKSLTDSESRERSETDETDSEQEAFNDVTGDPSPGVSPLLPPIEELTQGNVLESRLARDQAIQSLKKEVTQLRQHLENSLNKSPMRGILGQSASTPSLQEGKTPHFDPGFSSPVSRRGAAQNETKDKNLTGSSVSHEQDLPHRPVQGERGVRGPYTGSRYQLAGSPSLSPNVQVTVPHCLKCQQNEKQCHVSMNTSREDDSAVPLHPDCPLCHGNNESDNAPRTEISHGHCNKRHHCSNRRHPHCRHRLMSHTSPVTYIQTPLVPYSPPVIYGTSSSYYVPVGYNVADLHSPYTVTSPPKADVMQLEDLSWPLNRALEAAKELKVTSRRMCQSLTMDLSVQRHLRSSCLF